MSDVTWSELCMMCGEKASDADEMEMRGEWLSGVYVETPILWVYCRSCDCWTEHSPREVLTATPVATASLSTSDRSLEPPL